MRCVLAGVGYDRLRCEACKCLVKGPTRPHRETFRYAPESSAKSSVLNSEPWLRQYQAEIIAHRDVWELHLNIRTYRYQIAVGATAAVLGRKVGTGMQLCPIISRTHTLPRDLGECGTQRIVETGEPLHADPQPTQMTKMGLRPRPARQPRSSASTPSSAAPCALHDTKMVGDFRVGLSDSSALYNAVRPRPMLS